MHSLSIQYIMKMTSFFNNKPKARAMIELSAYILAVIAVVLTTVFFAKDNITYASRYKTEGENTYIKWAEFNVPLSALSLAANAQIAEKTVGSEFDWIETLALCAVKYGGNWSKCKDADIRKFISQQKSGADLSKYKTAKFYNYFYEVYSSVLINFLGKYEIDLPGADGGTETRTKYGLTAFSPIAEGYGFSHYDDFGNSRNYGYKRRHLGHDIMGNVGTPIIAVEGGIVEELGWNQYGGWRIGIRSHDKRRYYYYAHLRKDKPYHMDTVRGAAVTAGQVIGYLGMTGYSSKENVNNINVPHLHFGLQLIFDESQKEGPKEIWVDVYSLFNFLQRNRSTVILDKSVQEHYKRYPFRIISS